MDRNQRISQPKPYNGNLSGRSNSDAFLEQPTMARSPHTVDKRPNINSNAVNSGRNLGGSRGGPGSRSQDRLNAHNTNRYNYPNGNNPNQNNTRNEYNDMPQNPIQKPNSGVASARPNHNRNASADIVSRGSYNNDLNRSVNAGLRPMPVYERENVFNEWGAVIKHQDEIDRELKRQQDVKMRERQKNYKRELDRQFQESLSKKKGSMSEQAKREEEMLKNYQRDLEEKQRLEDEKRNKVLGQQKDAAFQSMNERNIMKIQKNNIHNMERQLYHDKMKQQETLDNQRRKEEKEKMKNDMDNYSRILQLQHKSKMDKLNSEKAADRQFSEAERAQLNKQEDQRNKFFEKLAKIQENNDLKQQKLKEYMEQDPKEIRSRQDEVNYLKNLEIAEKKNKAKDIETGQKKNQDKISNYRSLAQQLQEKQFQQQNIKSQENAFATELSKEADKYRKEIEDEKQRKQRQKEEYYKALSNQINENKKRKQYSVLMSEHERRVNDRDIKAYEHKDTHNLYSKVIGFGGDNRLDKYIDKSVGVNNSQQNSPNIRNSKHSALNDSNLAKMGQISLNNSGNILTDQVEPQPRFDPDNPYPLTKLQKVRDNMEKQDAIKYRANTVNRAYGFEQNLQKEPPANKRFGNRDESNPYEYNFVAPGNY